jgi:hypothetical protein
VELQSHTERPMRPGSYTIVALVLLFMVAVQQVLTLPEDRS